ncbi:UDP-N-acetylmuramate dehydrogenase [soil metagenome]
MLIRENYPLSELVYYRIGGLARFVLEVSSPDEVKEALTFCKQKDISDILVLGLGSNVILPDTDFLGCAIFLSGDGSSFKRDGEKIKAFAGESMDSLIKESLSESLVGLEWAGGLPSSVGGAVRGNAGAFGSETKDTFLSAEIIDVKDPELGVKSFSRDEAGFSYRDSYFKHHPNLVIVTATFQLKEGAIEEVKKAEEVYKQNSDYRQTHHPMDYPSCGSVFKNITKKVEEDKIFAAWPDVKELSEKKWYGKVSMGYLINRLGFSEKKIGGAMVSSKHTNYIVNINHAKGEDVKAIIKEIQTKFEATFGFRPEPEVMIVTY